MQPCSFPSEFKSPAAELYKREKVLATSFKVSNIIELKEGDEEFSGAFFYNATEIMIGSFSGDFTGNVYAIAFFDRLEGGEMLFMISFPEPLSMDKIKYKTRDGHLLFSFPPKILFSHFGTGTYTPGIDEMLKKNETIKVPGCPYKVPKDCSYYKAHKKCGFNQEDNICRLVVSMSAVSRSTPTSIL